MDRRSAMCTPFPATRFTTTETGTNDASATIDAMRTSASVEVWGPTMAGPDLALLELALVQQGLFTGDKLTQAFSAGHPTFAAPHARPQEVSRSAHLTRVMSLFAPVHLWKGSLASPPRLSPPVRRPRRAAAAGAGGGGGGYRTGGFTRTAGPAPSWRPPRTRGPPSRRRPRSCRQTS